MAVPPIPNVQAPVVGAGGLLTPQWHSFFLRLRDTAGGDTALQTAIDKVVERLDELEAGGTAGTFLIQGLGSIVVNGTPAGGTVQVLLDNDNDAPGATWYYGTGPDGARGWFAAADALAATTDLTKAVDAATGITTLGLADLANTGTGTAIYKTTRDAKGRTSGQVAANTDDLPESGTPTNQWFTTARAAAAAPVQEAPKDGNSYARKDGAWAQVTAGASIQFPFYDAAGAFSPVPLTSDNKLPFYLADGTQSNIPMVTA